MLSSCYYHYNIYHFIMILLYVIVLFPVTGSFEFTGVQNSHGTMDNSDGSLSVDNSWTYMTWYKNLGSTGFLFVFYPSESSCSHGMLYM